MDMPDFSDSHCHFDFSAFDDDRAQVWAHCQQQGVARLIVPGIHPAQWQQLPAFCRQHSGIFYAAGLHPCWITDALPLDEQTFKTTIAAHYSNDACIAIGECGLDKKIALPLDQQLKIFHWHCQVAEALNAPLIMHCLKFHSELLAVLKHYKVRGVVHAFSGSRELARQYTDKGFLLGVGGVITWARAAKTRDAIHHTPLEFLLLETDAPDMPLAGQQGQRNSPLHIPEVAAQLAQLKGIPLQVVARQCERNLDRLFFQKE